MKRTSEVSRKGTFIDYLPGILQGISIFSFIGSTVTAVKATPKALKLIEAAKEEKGEELTAGETISAAWKSYVPTVIFGVVGVGTGVAACAMQYNYNAALLAAGTLAERALISSKDILANKVEELDTYRQKVVEAVGEEKEKDISDRTDKTILASRGDREKILLLPCADEGKELFRDCFTGQYVYTTKDDINSELVFLNQHKQEGDDIYLDDYCDAIGIERVSIGEDFYWPSDSPRVIKVVYGVGESINGRLCRTIRFSSGCGPIGVLK